MGPLSDHDRYRDGPRTTSYARPSGPSYRSQDYYLSGDEEASFMAQGQRRPSLSYRRPEYRYTRAHTYSHPPRVRCLCCNDDLTSPLSRPQPSPQFARPDLSSLRRSSHASTSSVASRSSSLEPQFNTSRCSSSTMPSGSRGSSPSSSPRSDSSSPISRESGGFRLCDPELERERREAKEMRKEVKRRREERRLKNSEFSKLEIGLGIGAFALAAGALVLGGPVDD